MVGNFIATGWQMLLSQFEWWQQVISTIALLVIFLAIWAIGRFQKKPGILSLIFVSFCFAASLVTVGISGYSFGTKSSGLSGWADPYKPELIVGKTYRNSEVVLDGRSYSNDTFYNVTFVYDGTTPINFSNNTVHGFPLIRTNTPAVWGTVTLMKGFGFLRPEIAEKLQFTTHNVSSTNTFVDSPLGPPPTEEKSK